MTNKLLTNISVIWPSEATLKTRSFAKKIFKKFRFWREAKLRALSFAWLSYLNGNLN